MPNLAVRITTGMDLGSGLLLNVLNTSNSSITGIIRSNGTMLGVTDGTGNDQPDIFVTVEVEVTGLELKFRLAREFC